MSRWQASSSASWRRCSSVRVSSGPAVPDRASSTTVRAAAPAGVRSPASRPAPPMVVSSQTARSPNPPSSRSGPSKVIFDSEPQGGCARAARTARNGPDCPADAGRSSGDPDHDLAAGVPLLYKPEPLRPGSCGTATCQPGDRAGGGRRVPGRVPAVRRPRPAVRQCLRRRRGGGRRVPRAGTGRPATDRGCAASGRGRARSRSRPRRRHARSAGATRTGPWSPIASTPSSPGPRNRSPTSSSSFRSHRRGRADHHYHHARPRRPGSFLPAPRRGVGPPVSPGAQGRPAALITRWSRPDNTSESRAGL